MYKLHILFLFVLSVFVLNSCNDPDFTLPNITGRAGEVVVVMDDVMWTGNVGEALRNALSKDYPCLPQSEPYFDLVQIPEKAFTSIFATHRNLILFEIDKDKKTGLSVMEDLNAHPQTVLTFYGPDRAEIASYIEQESQKIIDIVSSAERQRIIDNYRKYENKEIGNALRKNHSLEMFIPKGYTLDVDTTSFAWISHETPQISQGILVYYYPYTDTAMFTRDKLIAARDSILKKNVPGPIVGSYMTTEKDILSPVFDEFLFNKKYVAELRGLWKVEGDFMGGPFVSISTIDEKRSRLVTVEGYVYAPKFDKRNYLRQVEAVLYSLSFYDNPADQKNK